MKARRNLRTYAIYCFAHLLLCFQVKLGWFDEPASSNFCRSRWRCRGLLGDDSSYSTRKSAVHTSRTLKTFGCLSKESLGALWLRNNAVEAEKYLFKWSPPSVRRQQKQQQAPWRLFENKLAKLVASTTDMEPVPEEGCELFLLFPQNQGNLGELTVAGTVLRLKRICNAGAMKRRNAGGQTELLLPGFQRQVHLDERTEHSRPGVHSSSLVNFISTLNHTYLQYYQFHLLWWLTSNKTCSGYLAL